MNRTEIEVLCGSKQIYEAPKIEVKKIELEYGIASGSNATQQGWKDSQTISEEVENNYW
ncbi:hypothetical protein [Sphingobacterium detergens]|uniref:Uncharacterized protein n=1 Tax=Sphingobacterium detergens TaxID=1145106 RepID=A0A420ALP8_SPHD1|nr:hypothetical protein [Sphingobacterium detergens]RKE45368.1 hypothetical protein DFQ12_4441 [Sphingobacterium detergens]